MKRIFLLLTVIWCLMLVGSSAFAAMITLDTAYSNWDPDKIATYGTVEITDVGGMVQFQISGLAAGEGGQHTDIRYLYFNTTGNLAGLHIESSTFASAALNYSFDSTNNTYRASGDGYFDGRMNFGNGTPQLSDVTFVLDANSDITVVDFLDTSRPGPGGTSSGWTLVAHLQSTAGTYSSEHVGGNPDPGLSSVPEPATMLLLGFGLVGLAGFGSRKFFKKA